jgi:RNAse (barnase) inhibitor barstar
MKSLLPAFDHNGLYAAPADIAPLRRAARAAGLSWLEVDLQRVRGKRALFAAFARAFGFPATFGNNWDALADGLQDLSWRERPDCILQLKGMDAFAAAAPEDHAVLCEILEAAAQYWRGRRRLFVMIAGNASSWPAWPPR